MRRFQRLFGTVGAAALASGVGLGMARPASAAEAPRLSEVVVTAQKVEQSISKVPVAVSVLTGDQFERRHYENLEDFKGAVPGLQVNNYSGEARANIRGIGMNSLSFGADSQVAFNFNGVYVTSARAAEQSVLDIERIEVLRGPQGTLYGRNATGGAINVITRRPTDTFEGWAQLDVGNYHEVGTQAVVSGPLLGDRILGRLAVASQDHSGYSRNLLTGDHYDAAHTRTYRGTLVFNLSDAVTFTLVGDYHREDDTNYATHLFGTSPGFPVVAGVALGGSTVPLDANGQVIDKRLLNINSRPENKQENGGVSGQLDWTVNENLKVRSLTAWRKERLSLTFDFDSTPVSFSSTIPGADMKAWEGDEEFSEELQLIGRFGRADWVAGLYYYHDEIDPGFFWLGINVSTPSAPFIVPLKLGGTTTTKSYAAFGQLTYHLTDQLNLIGGVRFSDERRSSTSDELLPAFGVHVTDAKSLHFTDVSPKVSVQYQWTPELMTYATVAKGYQAGGFDISASPPLVAFDPEKVWDYEVGAKYRSGSLAAELSAFHYNYDNLQVAQIVNGLPNTTNAASSRIDGVEGSVDAFLTSELSITASVAYLDARFTQFVQADTLTGVPTDLTGRKLPGSAKLATNVLASYRVPLATGELELQGEWNWHDRIYFTEFNARQLSQAPTSTFNASVRYSWNGGKVYVEAYGKNLGNELIYSQAYITGAGFGSMVLGQLAPPRTFGVRLHYGF